MSPTVHAAAVEYAEALLHLHRHRGDQAALAAADRAHRNLEVAAYLAVQHGEKGTP